MGGKPYTGTRLGDGPIFEVSVLHLDAKERPGKLPVLSFIIQIVAAPTIGFSLIQTWLSIKSKDNLLSGRYFTVCR